MMSIQMLLLILSIVDFGSSLPVTSKPIENTPEHLAWEAWIMIPPTQNKTRKITPKSIFILPNKTTSPQINCPPGHVVENSQCIQTVQIDPNSILLNHLANVLPNATYDFEYDYEEYEEPHKLVAETSNRVPDYNDGPLKIGLLDPTSIKDDNGHGNDYDNSAEEDDLNRQPFRGEESSSTTTSTTTTTQTPESSSTSQFFAEPTAKSTPNLSSATVTIASSTAEPSTAYTAPSTASTTAAATPDASTSTSSIAVSSPTAPTFLSVESVSSSTQDSSLPVSSGTASSSFSLSGTSEDAIAFPNDDSNDGADYGFLEEEQEKRTTLTDDENVEVVTSPDYLSTDEAYEDEDSAKDSFQIHPTHQATTIEEDGGSDVDENGDEEAKDITTDKGHSISTETMSASAVLPLRKTSPVATIASETPTRATFLHTVSDTLKPTHNSFINKDFVDTTIHIHGESEPILGSIENSDRFAYHHLDDAVPSSKKPERSDTAPSEMQDQLRMINKIVEENKKRAELGSKIRFPSDTFIQTDNLRADFVRFPEPTASRAATPTMPTRLYTDTNIVPILRQPTVLAPTVSLKSMPTPSTSVATERQNHKPFWWLPSGWEVDRDGEKPLLLRFWSRASPTSSSSFSPATTGFRENSRRPTDNLYREISAHEFQVLGARNNRHHNINDFT